VSHRHHEPLAGEEQFVGPTEVTDARAIEDACRFRASVWSQTGALADRAFDQGRWRDDFEEVSRHWVITRAGEVVAAARLSVHDRLEGVPESEEYLLAGLRLPGRIASPGRVVVAPSAQRRGLASQLLEEQDRAAVEAGAAYAVRQASPDMCRLLTRRGWRDVAASCMDPRFPGVTFRVMYRTYDRVR
jgi:GNAT superfamily N-acetyltransferase